MPEGFTHVTLATKAAEQAGWIIVDKAAFAAGANGPDLFFSFEGWKSAPNRRFDLKGLGNQMHTHCTGAFLRNLCKEAKTQSQLDYFMGFLAHYTIDTTMHPYVQALCQKGGLYAGKCGHGLFEIALDTYVCKKATERRDFTIDEFAPKLVGAPLAEIAGQLDRAIFATYRIDVSRECILDAFFDNRRIRSIFSSRFGVKRAIFWLIEPLFGGRGVLTVHVHPRRLRGISKRAIKRGKALPNPWVDPVTGEVHEETLDELLLRAMAKTTEIYTALLNPKNARQFWALLGSYDYVTGTETEDSTFDLDRIAKKAKVS